MAAFQLTKWYADLVNPATGYLAICYASELRWKQLALRFTNILQLQPPGTLRTAASFVQAATAQLDEQNTTFNLRQRNWQGTWQQQAAPLRELLLETAHGSVLWECWLPAATAQLTVAGAVHHGLGYVEKLTLTLPPWQLPIQTLRWGRFVAAGHYLVWIRWDGPEPRHLIFHNGTRYADQGYIGDDYLQVEHLRLTFTYQHTLRAGAVGSTVFRRFPWFGKLFPARILHLDEAKWLSWATLTEGEVELAAGYVVHERVAWPS